MSHSPAHATGFLLKAIHACPDLQWLSPEQQWQLAARGHHRSLSAGEILFEKGDLGHSIFLIVQGDLEVYQEATATTPELILARLFREGEAFGEWAATRKNQTRSASVRAKASSTLLEIPYSLIQEIGALTGFLGHSVERGHKLKNRDSLSTLSPLFNLMTRQGAARFNYQEKEYRENSTIFSKGGPSKEVYLILEGSVEILEEDLAIHVMLGKGQIFGILGVTKSAPRSKGARAATDCRVLVLQAQDFLSLTRENEELSEHLLTLRKIYQTPTAEVVLQFHYQVEGESRLTSTIQLKGDRKLISDYSVFGDYVAIEMLPNSGDAMIFSFVDESRNIHRKLELTSGVITGARFQGPNPETGRIIEVMRAENPVTAAQLKQFESEGSLFESAHLDNPVCHCMQLTRSDLTPDGELLACDVNQLMQVTGAGTVCGSCRADLSALCRDSESVEMNILEVTEFQSGYFRIRFTPRNQDPLQPFQPGQHIQIESRIHGEPVRRSYTLTSTAKETRWREITIKRDPHGLFSRWLSKARPGKDLLTVSPPQGDFTADLKSDRPVILLVAGIGITPALNVMRSRVEEGSGPRIIVDHSFHKKSSGPCLEEMTYLADFSPDLEYHSRETIAGQHLKLSHIHSYHSLYPNAHWMVCGPEGYESSVLEKLSSAGVPDSHVRTERFNARSAQTRDSIPRDPVSLVVALFTTLITALVLEFDLLPQIWKDWQHSFAGHWISGSALLAFLGWQWILPVRRIRRTNPDSLTSLQLHRRLGALSPLLLLMHGSGFGAGILGLISVLFLTHTIIGVADRSLISGSLQRNRYLKVWLYPHIVISILLSALALFHLWLILGHGGP